MERLNRFYLALSRISQLMVRERDAQTLFTEMCRACVDTGHAQMACLYLREGDHALRAASAGPAEEFLAGVPQPWDMTTPAAQQSYTVAAMRDGTPLVSHDYANDPRAAAWRELALRHGVKAMAWVPVQRGGQVIGVLMLSAAVTGFFTEPLMQLLTEMVGGVAFALAHIDREAALVAALRQAQEGFERFSRLFHLAPLPGAIVSMVDRRVMDANEACFQRYGVTREELMGRTFSSLGIGVVAEGRARFYEEMRQQGRVRNLVTTSLDRAGTALPELINAEAIEFMGEPCHISMSLDLSALREAEQARDALDEARAASRAKTEFLSRMSHELRTPLHAVLGFAQLLQADAPGQLSPRQQTQVSHICDAGWHLLALINDVLDVSRIETGHLRVDARPTALQPLLDDALRMTSPLAGTLAVSIATPYRDQAPLWVQADPIRLRQVLINLLSNAFKYNRPAGTVQVSARAEGAQVIVEVIDTGLGMTRDQLAHLYEPFNRLGRERGGIEGAGIGLALTRQLVQLMQGQLALDSEAGVGTRARVTLPWQPASAGHEAEPGRTEDTAAERPASEHQPAGLVLYIEDNPVNGQLVEQMLGRWPQVRLVQAEDGASGLALARTLQPDLVLLDMHLPDMDGLALLRTLRGSAETCQLPVVALSASAMPDDVAAALAGGATDYWTKPLDFLRFTADVLRLLRPLRTAPSDSAA
ncbi:MAG TPA: ATP-binding protein [Ideonella sp.]|uniref:hybrid sensor histidine kinase/response regulator n=1 Tax=Ideonella sp. TaxID=1929293 RepID=UPI002BCC153A|nr:ATP-binding protein [Ideonella sp.]HSI47762.1 ATP-binding protein [Ideonella sp.]